MSRPNLVYGVTRFMFGIFNKTRWLSRLDVLCGNLGPFILFCLAYSSELGATHAMLRCQRTCRMLMAMRDVMHGAIFAAKASQQMV